MNLFLTKLILFFLWYIMDIITKGGHTMSKIPDSAYSGYSTQPDNLSRCCKDCKKFVPTDGVKGMCYEYEVLPYAGCNFFEKKENDCETLS
jgi:hypothetical protein